jgi:hypothetical protein
MKSLFTLLACLIITSSLHAQQTFNVAGNSVHINGMTFEYSIGEMALVSSERNANLIVTQGMLKPRGSVSIANDASGNSTLSDLSDNIKVYPNPTTTMLYVETTETAVSNYAYNLYDATGKVVLNQNGKTQLGLNKFSLDLQSFAAGSYYLIIQKSGETFSFKIQKMNYAINPYSTGFI